MGYSYLGTSKKGVKKWKITIELGYDNLGNRLRHIERFSGTLAEVKIKDAELMKKYYHKENNSIANSKNITFNEYSLIFIKNYCEPNISKITISNYKRLLKYILPLIGDCKLSKLTTFILDNMYQVLFKGVKGKELSYNSRYDYYKLINVMLNQAVKWDLISSNPNLNAQKPKKEKTQRKFYNLEQVETILNCIENEPVRTRALLTLALDTGARRGEIVALKWNDIDFNENTLRIDNSLKIINGMVDEKNAKTNSSKRTIILSEKTIKALKDYKEWQDDYIKKIGNKWCGSDRLFTNDLGDYMRPDTCYKIFKRVIKKYNLEDIRFHDLRHTSASIMINSGVNIKSVSERLGHSSINITSDIYTHIFDSSKKECAMAFDNIMKNNTK